MLFKFYKYQGTGNDFVIIDNRNTSFPKNDTRAISKICNRRFGIGADGLILLENDSHYDFKMVYFNSDGNQSSMCGNGGRCLVAFAKHLEIIENEATFNAIDGLHKATISNEGVRLQMKDVTTIEKREHHTFLDTGSPHHVQVVSDLEGMNLVKEGAKLRYGLYGEAGSNINFVSPKEDGVFAARTYERGVEDETLSCGTGVTAVALAMHHIGKTKKKAIAVHTPGGPLEVSFILDKGQYKEIFLKGPAVLVFSGEIEVDA